MVTRKQHAVKHVCINSGSTIFYKLINTTVTWSGLSVTHKSTTVTWSGLSVTHKSTTIKYTDVNICCFIIIIIIIIIIYNAAV